MLDVGFAVPEPLDRISGGYVYDREVASRLTAGDVRLRFIGLPEGFPDANPAMLEETARRLRDWHGPLLIDGLALGALPPDLSASIGARTVALIHHPLGLETGLPPARAAALIASERAALAAVRGVICASADTAGKLSQDFGVVEERLAVARPGVSRPERSAPLLGDPPVLLAIGSVTRRKNFDGLVQALARLTDLPWHARIVGPLGVDPAAEAALFEAIETHDLESRVTVTGPAPDVAVELLGADLLVSAALYEGFGMAMADATAHGLPVVAVDSGGAREAAAGGVLIAPGPHDSLPARLASALRPLIADRAERLSQSGKALTAAEKLPEWDETARIIAAALKRFLGDFET